MLGFLSALFFVIGFALAYSLWLRPLLRSRPSLAEFYARSDSFWQAVWAKIAFLKTKLAAGLLMVASALVVVHDSLIPIATSIDWTPLTSEMPSWAFPIAAFAIGAIFYWLRSVTARETDHVIAAVQDGVPVHEAVMMVASQPTPKTSAPEETA